MYKPKSSKHWIGDEKQPSTSKKTFNNDDFIFVKLLSKKNRVPSHGHMYGYGFRRRYIGKIGDYNVKLLQVEENYI